MTSLSDLPFWHKNYHADRRPLLLARGKIKHAIQDWFASQEFIEVDPCALQISPGNEAHLHAFSTTITHNNAQSDTRYLHTSPEFSMKKLLAAGEKRIYSFSHVWRNRERGSLHSPEFTMLEWYRSVESYTTLMNDCHNLLKIAAQNGHGKILRFNHISCNPFITPERLSVVEAFSYYTKINLLDTIKDNGTPDTDALAKHFPNLGLRILPDATWSDLFSVIMSAKIEPHLGHERLTILDRYPLSEAALAQPCPDDPRLAERFELYACGVELANGFGELTNADEQRDRFKAEMALKKSLYAEEYPIDEDFLNALSLMPPASGIALGFDRLVMLATGASRIDDVMWVPVA